MIIKIILNVLHLFNEYHTKDFSAATSEYIIVKSEDNKVFQFSKPLTDTESLIGSDLRESPVINTGIWEYAVIEV